MEYFVAKNGNDSNPGTSTSPFLTIQKASNVSRPGDIINVRAGTYTENLRISQSGSAGNYITFRAYGLETVNLMHANSGMSQYPNPHVDIGHSFSFNHFTGGIEFVGKSYVRVEGFNFIRNSGHIPSAYITLAGGSHHIIITKNKFINPPQNQAILNGYFSYNSTYATSDIEISYNQFSDNDLALHIGDMEMISNDHASNLNISWNTVLSANGICICIKEGCSGVKCQYNSISNVVNYVSWEPNYMGQAIYVDAYVAGISNVEVFGNEINNTRGINVNSEQGGLVQNIKVHHNIIKNSTYGVNVERWMGTDSGRPNYLNVVVDNNIAENSTKANFRSGDDPNRFKNIVFSNNLSKNGQIDIPGSVTIQTHNSWQGGGLTGSTYPGIPGDVPPPPDGDDDGEIPVTPLGGTVMKIGILIGIIALVKQYMEDHK